jgi:hypothetical protein
MSSQILHKRIKIIFTPYRKKPQIPRLLLGQVFCESEATHGGGGVSWRLLGCSLPPNPDLRNTCFVEIMTSKFYMIHSQLKSATEMG